MKEIKNSQRELTISNIDRNERLEIIKMQEKEINSLRKVCEERLELINQLDLLFQEKLIV
jgi:hypothetical protein